MKKKGGGTTVREEVGGVRDGGARRTGGRRCGVELEGGREGGGRLQPRCCSPSTPGNTPLMVAADTGNCTALLLLLEQGASINCRVLS